MRGGHASDVKRANSTAPVSALARGHKMRGERQTMSEAETATAAGSVLGDKRVGLPKEVKGEDYPLPVDDQTGTRESRESSSISQPQNDQGVIEEHGDRKAAETNLIDQRQDATERGITANDESLSFVPKSGFTERDGMPVEQNISKEEWRVGNTRQAASQSRVSTTPQHLLTQFSRENLDGSGSGGNSTPAANTSAVGAPDNAVTGMKKSGAGKGLTTAAFSLPSSLNEAPGERGFRNLRRISSDSGVHETSQESKRKLGGVGWGRGVGGATATDVSRQKEKLGGRNDQRRENASLLSKVPPPPPVPDPAIASGLGSTVNEATHSPHVEGTISSLIENHAPFLRWPMKSWVASEEAVRRWSFTAPMEPPLSTSNADPPTPPAFGSVTPAPRKSEPSEGPVNPRAMYGQVPPPVHPEKDPRRRPSVIVLPEQAIEDDHDFRRSKSAVIISGAGQAKHAVSGTQVSTGRRSSDGGHTAFKTAVGSSLVSPSHARDVIGHKVERIKLVKKKNEAQGEARAMHAQTNFGGRGNGGHPKLARRVGDTAANGRRQTGGSAAMPNASIHRNEPQQVARGISDYIDDILISPRRISWEQQLRTTSGTINHSGTTASRPRKADKRSNDNAVRSATARGGRRGKARPVREVSLW